MDIQPATLTQVKFGRHSRIVHVAEDVLDVVRQLKEISPRLGVWWNEGGDYYTVYEKREDGGERSVLTTTTLDSRVVERVRKIGSEGYDVAKEIDRIDKAADRAREHTFTEQMGEVGEKLFHAFRSDLAVKDSIVVPRRV